MRHLASMSAGLGLRRSFLADLCQTEDENAPDFIEVAPENWLGMGGRYAKQLRACSERFPLVCHGLSLSIGGYRPLDEPFVLRLKAFFQQHQVRCYSEHLSYTGDDGHLYDLLPIPFTEAAARHVAERVMRVQDILGQRIALENVSYYAAPCQDMTELEFLLDVVRQADCQILLDVNNVYVNSINHHYDPKLFIRAIPPEKVAYLHIAGHYVEAEDLRIDTHGADVDSEVWQLLATTYQHIGLRPTLLERDFHIPPLADLYQELAQIRQQQRDAAS
ncbi:DUF692 domain-containing protein [Agitococcus lubricus]|uniref:Uncharacterized protein n=1 Tax=Agitococcus lubricus TaxID=1077255 RepID=A0A2T5IX30_9GAMM|nr:DUF692 domain-containing protein [Agitococcus lubricus]PTQ88508.1 hypothetical protein C8N29_11129 [Agitococcus lubricus]